MTIINAPRHATDKPLRSEIFSREGLAEYARELSEQHQLANSSRGTPALYKRFEENENLLQKIYLELLQDANNNKALTFKADWLLDNYHIVKEQIRDIRQNFPKGYYRSLPKLAGGEYAKYPRVYHLAYELVSHTDAAIDNELITIFINAYQSQVSLESGELWAVPIMLRFALIENLRRLALSIIESKDQRVLVDDLVNQIVETDAGTDMLLMLASKIRDYPDFLSTAAVGLVRQLKERGSKSALTLMWIEERLKEQGHDSELMARSEHHLQATNQISIGNTVTSLLTIKNIDWKNWFESVSIVHQTLKSDPANRYTDCDFHTRDQYRKSIENFSRSVKISETEVAKVAIGLAEDYLEQNKSKELIQDSAQCYSHVGYYLIGKGLKQFKLKLKYKEKLFSSLKSIITKRPFLLYITIIIVLTCLMMTSLVSYASSVGSKVQGLFLLVAVFALPLSDLASNITQWLVTRCTWPKSLPKLDLDSGVPRNLKTIIALQVIFKDRNSVKSVIEGLEVTYLANDDPNIVLALLADLPDSNLEILPEDSEIIDYAKELIENLNLRHGLENETRFSLLFRKRLWNPSEGVFMGWERKRGKISEFNRLVFGDRNTTFVAHVGDITKLSEIKYVITLDSDSCLPRGAAKRLIGTIAHPLNCPVFDLKKNIVVDGYGIIQPRVGILLKSAKATNFSDLFSGNTGLDPYTQMVSDVYQDLFFEGSYIGKGIYDIRAFETALHNRVPENSLLSHDLFEGCFARVGLVTDVEIFDNFPSTYQAYSKRLHRWVRGDWQLLPWIFNNVLNAKGQSYQSPISILNCWKILDNLRRSLIAPSLFLSLVLALTVLPGTALPWILVVLIVIAFPVYAGLANALILPPLRVSVMGYARGVGRDFLKQSLQSIITICFLPYQTYLMCDSILNTLYRVYFSHRGLLEWEVSEQTEKNIQNSLKMMLPSIALMLIAAVLVILIAPANLIYAAPFLILWLFTPYLVSWLNRPLAKEKFIIPDSEKEYLNTIAWETWGYFDEMMVEEHNYLVPDNIQLTPRSLIAERTSPTNLSLSILSVISAYDMGFLTLPAAIERLEKTYLSLAKLERFHGHFFNWYQTKTLATLFPRYVSFVDSGNFVGHLIAVRTALHQFLNAPLITENHQKHILVELSNLMKNSDQSFKKYVEKLVVASNLPISSSENQLSYITAVEKFIDNISRYNDLSICVEERKVYALERLLSELKQIVLIKTHDHSSFLIRLGALANQTSEMIEEVEFGFLYDKDKGLFAIGYHVDDGKKDNSYFDLLASEARLGSFVAIALGQVPQKHWFYLGRSLVNSAGGPALISWSATIFEYLMPLLVMHDYPGTVLSLTYRAVVKAQQKFAKTHNLPWGVSESAYSRVNFENIYQYKAFGVPTLGLKRGLADDLVVSPYSTFLALLIDPQGAIDNLKELEEHHMRGRYGFFEAIDYTPERLASDETSHVVQSFFSHHHGMTLVALNNLLHGGIMQDRFHDDPWVKSTILLLHEKFPDPITALLEKDKETLVARSIESDLRMPKAELITTPHTYYPKTRIISNGQYTVMLDNAGSGFSVFDRDIALTSWQEDSIGVQQGFYIFVRDLDDGKLWSVAYQPTKVEPESYEVIFNPDKVEYRRRDFGILLHTEITVSPEDNVELRKVTVTNLSGRRRNIELTSYAEVVLANSRSHKMHPAFSKMFIESEYNTDFESLIFSRRPRSNQDEKHFLMHMLSTKVCWEPTQYESSRMNFIGRGHNINNPEVFKSFKKLSASTGALLDPVFSLRTRLELEIGQTEFAVFATGFARSREEVMLLAERYHGNHSITRAFEMAWSNSNIELRNEQFSIRQINAFQKLVTALLYNVDKLRGRKEALLKNKLNQSALWRFAISGDLPLVLLRLDDPSHTKLAQDLLFAHQYIRMRGISFDLVIVNEYQGGYFQTFQEELEFITRSSSSANMLDKKGGIYLRTITQLTTQEIDLLETVARAVFTGAKGSLSSQLKFEQSTAPAIKRNLLTLAPNKKIKLPKLKCQFDNGIGGFVDNGYQIEIKDGVLPPLPWSNVIANNSFGFLVTESGAGYTWSENSRENKITPWSNDPVSDFSGEVIYLRDLDSGCFWNPTPKPVASNNTCIVTHMFGQSKFLTNNYGIKTELVISGSEIRNVKWWHLTVKNETEVERKLEAFLYIEWVLGVLREDSSRHIVSDFDIDGGFLHATNHYNNEFAGRVVSLGSNLKVKSYTTSRQEFIGRHHTTDSPTAFESYDNAGIVNFILNQRVQSVDLKNLIGTGFDTCGVIKVEFTLKPGEEREVLFYMSQADSLENARQDAVQYKSLKFRSQETSNKQKQISSELSTIQVRTPDLAFDTLLNGWLLYQTLYCRFYARSAFYQSGGAIGFRDQLQDVMALLYSRRDLARSQILLHASRQFLEGDVQHWWHPPTGRGVRTKISDDYLWLPYVVNKYLEVTGDQSLLEEQVQFIDGVKLEPHQADLYIIPQNSSEHASIYQHCTLALDRALVFGAHGLPLMGGGDWNDGMNAVGIEGKGESVWLAWFLSDCLEKFSIIAKLRNDFSRAEHYQQVARDLVAAIDEHAWDGQWYHRAYFDDGTALGSSQNEECKIDSLSQTWAMMTGKANPERRKIAMQSVRRELVNKKEKLINLLTPAFDKTPLDPGYIKGYAPGIRENGGQYTHAAAWVVLATTLEGKGTEAFDLFSMINPINHSKSFEGAHQYKAEPYVLAGDVYSSPDHLGRAGWSWYTGSAAWMYQVGIENILGFKLRGDYFTMEPVIPASWKEFSMTYRYQHSGSLETKYEIKVLNPESLESGVKSVQVNGELIIDSKINFKQYLDPIVRIEVIIGR